MNNESKGPAQPAAAQEAVGWQFWHNGEWRSGSPDHVVKDHRKNTEAAGILVRDVYAAPITAAPVIVPDYVLADDANRLYGEGYGVDWVFEGRVSTPAAPGIDLATAIRNCCEAEQADPDHPDTICINVNDLTAIMQQCVIDASPKGDVHPDDLAVDAFAAAMKAKLADARAKGRGGWRDDEPGMQQRLSDMLRAHVEKGDPRDVANFCMFLHQRGEAVSPNAGSEARARFEVWAASENMRTSTLIEGGEYVGSDARFAWKVWQAAVQAANRGMGVGS